MTVSDLMTTTEVAELCRTSESTVRYWRLTGTGPTGFKLGRRVLYQRIEVERWIAEQASSGHRDWQE